MYERDLIRHIGVLGESSSGWQKQLNIVSWGKREPKYDIREWSPDGEKISKGVTLTEDEAKALLELLKKEFEC